MFQKWRTIVFPARGNKKSSKTATHNVSLNSANYCLIRIQVPDEETALAALLMVGNNFPGALILRSDESEGTGFIELTLCLDVVDAIAFHKLLFCLSQIKDIHQFATSGGFSHTYWSHLNDTAHWN